MATLHDLTVADYFVIEFKYNDTIQKVNFKIVGIADFYQNSYVYAPLDAMRFVFGLDNNSYNAKYSQQDSLEVQDWITLNCDGNNNLQGLKPLLNSLLDMSAVKQIALKYNNIIAIMIAIIIFFATTISVVILVIITNIVITENKKMIIVFQTLGYKIHEVSNIIMSAYIPTIIIAFLVGVPISIIILKELFSNFKDKYWQGKKPLLNIGICKNTVLLKTQQNQGFIEISILIYKIKGIIYLCCEINWI